MMMTEVLIALGLFTSFVVVAGQVTRLLSEVSLNRTLREALRSHPDSVAPLAERLGARQPWADALIGWIFIALAIGLVVLGLFEPFEERRDIFQAAVVPAIVGLVALAYVRWAKREAKRDAELRRAEMPAPPPPPPPPAPPSPPARDSLQATPTRGRRTVRKPA